jgi:cadmium resistance protein CadD (predicted permease)
MANLDAVIDAVIHPDISYFDQEHLIVGGITGLVTIILFGMLSIYVASLKRAMKEIKTLEGLLPICSACHKIRTPDNNWHILETYISERTEAVFTHSLCPECARSLYPEMFKKSSAT